jgi:cellulose synthase/poly-beta-1,6-N-acetylglucosamine synthase-like glycosyltransferase
MSVNWVDRHSTDAPGRRENHPFVRRREAAAPDSTSSFTRQRGRPSPEHLPPGAGRPLPAEIAFLANHGVPAALLQYGAAIARRQGSSADAVLLAERLVPEEAFYRALAAELKVDFHAAPEGLEPSHDLAADAARGRARFARNAQGLNWLIAPRGAQIPQLVGVTRSARGRPLFALTSPSLFEEALRRASAARLARDAAYAAERVSPDLVVRPILAQGAPVPELLACLIPFAALASPVPDVSCVAAILLAALFLITIFLRLFALVASFCEDEPAPDLDDKDLPIYSVVVALYKEAAVADQLCAALMRLNYPRAKLDVKFVVECDDVETAQALRAATACTAFEIIVAPPGTPRTKPRALNVAAPFLKGSLATVFDAEDLPDPNQLRKSAAVFARADQRLACLQASLCIHNATRNWMTALFAIDYADLFQVFNKGVSAARLPFFLGGSSNHFRVEVLREIGCWDAYNVTEDADLGLRLARRGYETRTLSSWTYEEAPCAFLALLHQRTRWFKGWMQTALAHCRNAPSFFADLGPARAIVVLAIFAGGFLGPLLTPLFTGLFAYQAAFGDLLAPKTTAEALRSALWCFVAVSGTLAPLASKLAAMRREGLMRLWPALFFSPLWSLMLTLAAWRALRDLCLRPFYWDKTKHGLADPASVPSTTAVRRRAIA